MFRGDRVKGAAWNGPGCEGHEIDLENTGDVDFAYAVGKANSEDRPVPRDEAALCFRQGIVVTLRLLQGDVRFGDAIDPFSDCTQDRLARAGVTNDWSGAVSGVRGETGSKR